MQKVAPRTRVIRKTIRNIQKSAIEGGLNGVLLRQYNYVCNYNNETANKANNRKLVVAIVVVFLSIVISVSVGNSVLSVRCLLPNNYLVWEATRPLADCGYCADVTKPIILQNVSRRDFANYAYSSQPIIVKNAISHWRATGLNFYKFKRLYENTVGSYESVDEGCQFLNFKTDLFTLKEVFNMPDARANNEPGEKPWYVGWGNCHPDILAKVRQYYDIPEFLPEDAEFPATENIFFGYEMGAVMHLVDGSTVHSIWWIDERDNGECNWTTPVTLKSADAGFTGPVIVKNRLDYISRLMWQGQVRGLKKWFIAPVPECDDVCHKLEYYVEPGDIVFLDTRLWYHATSIPKGQFSLTVQSEYG